MPPSLRQRVESALALDEGRRVSLPLLLAVVAVAAASWLLFRGELPWVLGSGDAYEYAEMARRLSQGEGFTTGVVYPAELWLGADASHPAVTRAPGWPLLLAGVFRLAGPQDAAAVALAGALFAATALVAAALAMHLAGRAVGCLAGLAVATSPQLLIFSLDPVSEPLFGFWVTLFFLLLVRGSAAPWLGIVSGLAYLTRYNGALLLPIAFAVLLVRRAPARSLIAGLAGFAGVVAPWWLRNLLVTGNPFYSLLNLNLYAGSELQLGASIFFELDPQGQAAATALAKLRSQAPRLLAHLPFASANLAAFVGLLLACVRRERASLAFAGFGAATLGVVVVAVPLGRYFAPCFPALLALGAAGWGRHGGRLRLPGLGLLLAAPLLPAFPTELPDVTYLREHLQKAREAASAAPPVESWSCLAGRPLLIAQQAARVVWRTGAVAIYAPIDPVAFWRIVDAHPVAWAQLARPGQSATPRFRATFEPRPDCGPGVYQRRAPPPGADARRER